MFKVSCLSKSAQFFAMPPHYMAQWVNRLRNNIFVNPPPLLPLLCEISGALHLAQPSLVAGRLADEIQVNFKIFKIGCRSKYLTCCFV